MPWASGAGALPLIRLPRGTDLGWIWEWLRAGKADRCADRQRNLHQLTGYSHDRLRSLTTALQLDYDRTENMLVLVPNSMREAAFALGAPKWVVVGRVTLRAIQPATLALPPDYLQVAPQGTGAAWLYPGGGWVQPAALAAWLICMFSPAPGSNRLTRPMPMDSDTTDAVTNQAIALKPIRPTERELPRLAIPPTSVANTSGAMIILIRRRKMSVTMEK